ncbi:MAG: hypothetical protein MUE34_10005 [Acidimicrobiales bacterium]|nr:hypothetical protein [Acidimicrobiales bacterium]
MPEPTTTERLAHALTPWEWRGRNLALLIVVFAAVAAVTVVQRALLAEGAAGWVWVGAHGAIAVLVVTALSRRAVHNWRAVQAERTGNAGQADEGPGQPSAGVPS